MHGLMGERRNHADATNSGIEPVHRRQWCASALPDHLVECLLQPRPFQGRARRRIRKAPRDASSSPSGVR